MAKIKKKDLKERLNLEIAEIERSREEWQKLYENVPTLEGKETQMAYLYGMIWAYERLKYIYNIEDELAD